jgi:hypothetical protein
VSARRSSALARHRNAFREVVWEGLLNAWRDNVSIPYAHNMLVDVVKLKLQPGECATCLFGEDGVSIGGVTPIHFDLLQVRISFCRGVNDMATGNAIG